MRDVRSLILKGFLIELVFYFNIEKLTRRKRRKKGGHGDCVLRKLKTIALKKYSTRALSTTEIRSVFRYYNCVLLY